MAGAKEARPVAVPVCVWDERGAEGVCLNVFLFVLLRKGELRGKKRQGNVSSWCWTLLVFSCAQIRERLTAPGDSAII
jgi:hypothetical protein